MDNPALDAITNFMGRNIMSTPMMVGPERSNPKSIRTCLIYPGNASFTGLSARHRPRATSSAIGHRG
eukprot:2953285-Prymnesium_polylepis.1